MQIVCKIFTNYVNACREFQFEETTEQRNKQKQNAHNSKQIGSGRGVLSLFSFMHNTYGILYTFLLLLPFYIAVGQCRLTWSEHYHSKMPPNDRRFNDPHNPHSEYTGARSTSLWPFHDDDDDDMMMLVVIVVDGCVCDIPWIEGCGTLTPR